MTRVKFCFVIVNKMSCGKAPHNAGIITQSCDGDTLNVHVSDCDHSGSIDVRKDALKCIPNVTDQTMKTQFHCPETVFNMALTHEQRQCALSHSTHASSPSSHDTHTKKTMADPESCCVQ